jgi:DNA repair protein RadB
MCRAVLHKIPTDCEAIDKTLEGGIPLQSVSVVYGEAETGKTTLAIQCAVNCARQGYKTLFVDCDRAFSARRLSQIAIGGFKDIAERIILMKPDNFVEQARVIDQLTDYITKSFALVVVDTITSLYRAEIAERPEKTFELNRELNRQMACLAQLARTQEIAVLMTSQVRSVFNVTYVGIEPVATRVLKFWADTIIAMKPTEKPQVIKAILEKSSKKAPPLTCHLKIEETGIHEYSIR